MSAGMTVQVVGHETGKEDNTTWTRLQVVNSRGRFYVKFKGPKAEHLTRDLVNTLGEGETIATKRLFIELSGEWTTFTRPDSTFKVRYFKASDYKVIDGPSLELARIRGDALNALQTAETLRNAGALAQAYKAIATHLAELAQFPLDLSEVANVDDALIGQVASEDEDYNPEAAAAAYYEREEAAAKSKADEEDAVIDARGSADDFSEENMDEIVLSAGPDEGVDGPSAEDSLEIEEEGEMLDSPSAEEEVAAETDAEETHADTSVAEEAASAPAPTRRFGGFGRRS